MANAEPGIIVDGIKKKSISNIETIDLIVEGPIEGPVKQEYNYVGTLGATGWDTVNAQPEKNFLSSLYLNDTPVMDEQGLYNFQNIEVAITKGQPNGGIGNAQYFNDWDMHDAGVDYWKSNSSALFNLNDGTISGPNSHQTCELTKVINPNPRSVLTYRQKQAVLSLGSGYPSRVSASKYGEYSVKMPSTAALVVRDPVLSDDLYNFWPRQGGFVATEEEDHTPEEIIEAQNKQAFTFEAWVQGSNTNVQALAGKGDPATPGGWMLLLLPSTEALDDDGNFYFQVTFINNGLSIATGYVIQFGNWAHVAVCLSERAIKIFVDGVEQTGGGKDYPNIKLSSPTDLFLGRHPTKSQYPLMNVFLDNICMSSVSKYTVNFTPGKVEPSDSTLFLIDGEEWRFEGEVPIIPQDDSIEINTMLRGTFLSDQRFVLQGNQLLKDLNTAANAEFYDFSCVNAKLLKNNTPQYDTTITDPGGGSAPSIYFDGTEGLANEGTLQNTSPMVDFSTPHAEVFLNPNYYNYTTNGSREWLFETWIYPDSMSNGDEQFVAGLMRGDGTSAPWMLTTKHESGATKIYWSCVDITDESVKQLSGSISTASWNHVQVIYNGSYCRLFVDGIQVDTRGIIPSHETLNEDTRFCIARSHPNVIMDSFKGYIFNARILGGESIAPTETGNTSSWGEVVAMGPTVPTVAFRSTTNCKLLIHSNTTNGSQTFTDSVNAANSAHGFSPVNEHGGAEHSTAKKKFGTSSIYFDGQNNYLSMDTTAPSNYLGVGVYTVEMWFNTSKSGPQYLICRNSSQQYGGLMINPGSNYICWGGNCTGTDLYGYGMDISLNTWHHVAVVCNGAGNSAHIYFDGVQVGHTSSWVDWGFPTGSTTISIGTQSYGGGQYRYMMNGYIDEIRWSDVPRYSPQENYATLSSTDYAGCGTLSDGNLGFAGTGRHCSARSTQSIAPGRGKIYFEVVIANSWSNPPSIGIMGVGTNIQGNENANPSRWVRGNGYKYSNGSEIAAGYSTWSSGDIIGVEIDSTAGTLKFRINNGSWTTAFTDLGDITWLPAVKVYDTGNQVKINFGQDYYFSGTKPSGQDTSQDQFYYAPPSGAVALTLLTVGEATVASSRPGQVFALQSSGEDGNTEFTDLSSYRNAITANGSVENSTDVFAVMDSTRDVVVAGSNTFSEGDLKVNSSYAYNKIPSTVGVSTGKWYAEVKFVTTGDQMAGIAKAADLADDAHYLGQTGNLAYMIYRHDGTVYHNGTVTSAVGALVGGDILQIALDLDSGKVWWGKNGTWYGTVGSSGGTTITAGEYFFSQGYRDECHWNFGQDPTFSSTKTGPASSEFYYAPPSNFEGIHTLLTNQGGNEGSSVFFNKVAGTFLSSTAAKDGANFNDDDWTVELWVRPDHALSTANECFVSCGGSTANWNSSTGRSWSVSNYNNLIYFQWNTTGASFGQITTTNTAVPANEWTHIAVVNQSGTKRLYIGGVLKGESTTEKVATTLPTMLSLGQTSVVNEGPFGGYINNVSIQRDFCKYPDGNTFLPSTDPVVGYWSGGASWMNRQYGPGEGANGQPYFTPNTSQFIGNITVANDGELVIQEDFIGAGKLLKVTRPEDFVTTETSGGLAIHLIRWGSGKPYPTYGTHYPWNDTINKNRLGIDESTWVPGEYGDLDGTTFSSHRGAYILGQVGSTPTVTTERLIKKRFFVQKVPLKGGESYTISCRSYRDKNTSQDSAGFKFVAWLDSGSGPYAESSAFTPVAEKLSSVDESQNVMSYTFTAPPGTMESWIGVELLHGNSTLYFDKVTLKSGKGFPLVKAKPIKESLRGPTVDESGNPVGDNYSVDMFAKKYRIINNYCIGAEVHLKIDSLYVSEKSTGDLKDATIDSIVVKYRALIHNGTSAYINAYDEKITGRADVPFVWVFNLDFKDTLSSLSASDRKNFYGWEIKIYRTEPEVTVTNIKKSTTVDVLVEKYDSAAAYPNSAVIRQRFNSEYFNNIPSRSVDVRLLRVRVPSNYNPIKKTYDESQGPWDGTWKVQKYWTDNPAWCFLDMITNDRYGLGRYIPLDGFDKWTLYKIAQYCDVIVPDGAGGMEPRLTLNTIITSREDAFKVVNDMASVFRGLLYYAAGQIYAIQDSKKDPIYTFTNANAQDGNFTYSNKSRKERYNVGVIRYNDKTNFYKPAIEYVEDLAGIRANGVREQEITAFGCTSRGQAIRLGKWLVYTNNLEIENVSFKAGVEASYLRPGDTISISDNNRNPFRWGGRTTLISGEDVAAGTLETIQLDSFLDPEYISNDQVYKLSLMTPGWNYDSYNVSGMDSSDTPDIRRSQVQNFLISGSFIDAGLDLETTAPPKFSTIKLGGATAEYWPAWLAGGFDGSTKNINRSDYTVSNNQIWTINPTGKEFVLGNSFDASTTKEKLFRIVDIKEDEKQVFSVKAVENNPTKYDKIEDDLLFEQGGLYNSPTLKVPDGPTSLALKIDQFSPNSAQVKYSIGAPTSKNGLDAYQVFAKENSPFFSISDFTGNYPVLWTQHSGGSPSGRAFIDNTPLTKVVSSGTQYIPDDEHRIARIPALTQAQGIFRPEQSGSCLFKVFSVNSMNQYSLTSRSDRIIVPTIHPIEDVQVENLGLSTNEASLITTEKKKKPRIEFTGGSPTILWTSTLAGSGFVPSSYAYRLTVREPSEGTPIPNPNIIHEITGYRSADRAAANLSGFAFTYDLTGNLFYASGRRIFDIVVEAHNEYGESSAGGKFGQSLDPGAQPYVDSSGNLITEIYTKLDSHYTNVNGYDIVRLNNPSVHAHLSSDGDVCAPSDDICTTQQITLDNKVKMVFEKNSPQSFNRDVVGGFLYVSPQYFDVTGVQGVLRNDLRHDIQRIKFDYAPTIEVTPTGNLLLDGSAYMAYSLYDTFDQERDIAYRTNTKNNPIKNRGFDMARMLSVSSVREVKLDDTNTVRKIVKQGNQTLTFTLPVQRQWHFLKIEGSLQGERTLYTNAESQNEKWQELSELKNWKVYVNDVRVDQAENWASNPPSDKNFVFCKNSKWNGSTDLLPVFNILSKGVPLEQFNRDTTLTVKLEFEGTNVEFVNFSAEADYGRRY